MLYLLAASAEWLAAALVLGLIVGFWTTTREKGAKFAGYGVIAASAFALAGGFLVADLQAIPGRNGLYFELALLLATAYLIGLPFGAGARLLFGSAEPAKKKQPQVALRGAAALSEPAPTPTPAPAPAAPPPEAIAEKPVAASVAAPLAPQPAVAKAATPAEPRRRGAARPAESEKKTPGQRPEGLPAPRGGRADDLTRIKGVGPKSVEKLHGLGVYHFDQIAGWSSENVAWIGATLAVPGRPERGRWVAQARELAAAKSEPVAEQARAE